MRQAYTMEELLAVVIARDLKDDDKGLTGLASGDRTSRLVVGIPLAAMGLAQQMHAPNLVILYGGVIVNPRLDDIPTLFETGASGRRLRAAAQLSPAYTFSMARRGDIDVGFSTGAQVDRFGNINITCLGDYHRPRVRLVGAVFQTEHFSLFGREYIIMEHRRRSFVAQVDFITGVGYPGGAQGRTRLGLSRGGPRLVVTDLAVLGFNAATKRMQVESLHPGVRLEQVQEQTGFPLLVREPLLTTPPPTPAELAILRHTVDPHGRLLGRRAAGKC